MPSNSKNYLIYTFGCAMNEYDSERIASVIETRGYLVTDDIKIADLVILNTCSVRAKPEIKIASYLGVISKHERLGKRDIMVGVTGCVAQNLGLNLLKSFPVVDFVVGTDALGRFEDILDRALLGERFVDVESKDELFTIGEFERKKSLSAQITIMKGCENFCSYCIVPYVRGIEASRNPLEILDEIRKVIDRGSKEIVLLGQNVNSYRGVSDDGSVLSFADLLRLVNELEGIERIRFITSHPKDFNKQLIDTIAELDKVCRYIHLPAQSGSDKILSAMNRSYTVDEYKRNIDYAREIMPDIGFSSDFIVGFPNESDEDFQATLELMRYAEFDHVFAFKYSARQGTAAAMIKDTLTDDIKTARLLELFALKDKIGLSKLERSVGNTYQVLVTGMSALDSSKFKGLSVYNRGIHFSADREVMFGDIVNVKITECRQNSLIGHVCSS